MQNHPLTATDFDFIDDTLMKYGDDHSVLNPSELDGFFTALVSSPVQIDIAVWFPAIWGGQNPDWDSPEEGKQFIELCVRHINSVAIQLATDAQAFKARFEQTEHEGQPLTLAEEWCFGYLRGVGVGNWPQLPTALAEQLQSISECAEQDNFELPADLDVALHLQQVAAIEPAAIALYQYWVALR